MAKTLKELSDLRGRRALITGATGNLGRVFAFTLAQLGADLILVDLEGANFSDLTLALRAKWGVNVDCYTCNLEIQEERKRLIADLDNGQGINILINNAAFGGAMELDGWATSYEKQSIETWRRAIEVNLTAIFDLCQGLNSALKMSRGASIINISSIYGLHGPDWSLYSDTGMANPAAYSVSKGGLIQLTRWLATSVAPNIRVNVICPGGIERGQPKKFVKRYEAKTPLGRMATEEDFCGAIAYLASDLSNYVTGQVLAIDGGWGAW